MKIRYVPIVLVMLLCSMPPAKADVNIGIGIGLPNTSIEFNLQEYPELVLMPGYPVYYAPQLEANFFFYDGMYWVYQNDNWYESSWYNGPWWLVEPEFVPVFILRIPVRYYRQPPSYFFGWSYYAPPRWGDHWGHDWEQSRRGWDRWNRRFVHTPAPLPIYQRQFFGDQYPRQVEQQRELQKRGYRYQSQDPLVRQRHPEQTVQRKPQQEKQGITPAKRPGQQDGIDIPRSRSPQRGGIEVQRLNPDSPQQTRPRAQVYEQPQQQGSAQRKQHVPKSADQQKKQQGDKKAKRESKAGQEQEHDRNK
jgi:hypothetical protein